MYTNCPKNSFKYMDIHSFIRPFPRFPVDLLEGVKKLKSKFALEHGRRRLQIHLYIEFSQNVDWKLTAKISLKMRTLGFDISYECVFFRMAIITQNDHAASKRIASFKT